MQSIIVGATVVASFAAAWSLQRAALVAFVRALDPQRRVRPARSSAV
jgi:hypothetical protein